MGQSPRHLSSAYESMYLYNQYIPIWKKITYRPSRHGYNLVFTQDIMHNAPSPSRVRKLLAPTQRWRPLPYSERGITVHEYILCPLHPLQSPAGEINVTQCLTLFNASHELTRCVSNIFCFYNCLFGVIFSHWWNRKKMFYRRNSGRNYGCR